MAGEFFEYKAPQYVSSFAPLNLDMIHTGMMEKQERADKANTLFGDLMSKLGEVPTYDREHYDQAIGNIKGAFDNIYANSKGDLSGSYGKVINLISQARSDPFWKLNEAHVKAVDEQRAMESKIRASGKQPLIFKDATKIPIVDQEGRYNHPNAFTSDVQEPLDYEHRMAETWKSILTQEGGEGKMGVSRNAPGMYESSEWSGINPHQFGHKRDQGYSMYKQTDEYKQQQKLGLDENQIRQQFDAIGKAMTTDAMTVKPIYRDIPKEGKSSSGAFGNLLGGIPITKVGNKAFANMFSSLGVSDLSKTNQDSKSAARVLGNAMLYNDPKVVRAYSLYANKLQSVLSAHLKDGSIKTEDITSHPLLTKLMKGESLSPDQYAQLKDEVGDVQSVGVEEASSSAVRGTRGLPDLALKNPSFKLSLRGLSTLNKELDDTLESSLENLKKGSTAPPIFHLNDLATNVKDRKEFNDAIESQMIGIPGEELTDVTNGRSLGKMPIRGYDIHDFVFNPSDNKVYIRANIYTEEGKDKSKLKDDNTGVWLSVDNPGRANDIRQAFDYYTNNAASNALLDKYHVDPGKSKGDLIDKHTGERVKLAGGFKATKVEGPDSYYYQVTNPTSGKAMTNEELIKYLDQIHGGDTRYGDAVMRGLPSASALKEEHIFGNTSEIQQMFGQH